MNLVHLTASQFYGGPERQMLGLAQGLPVDCRTSFLCFSEAGRSQAFLDVVRRHGFRGAALENDTPRLLATRRELADRLREWDAHVLCCHGYKANVLGRLAARRIGIPAVAVSRGWTGESRRVRFYEMLDRLNLRWMDHVVAVSQAQADRVRQAGVAVHQVTVIRNAIRLDRFSEHDSTAREELQQLYPRPRTRIIGAAGRLSPEKGFHAFVEAAARIVAHDASMGFVLFGDGAQRQVLMQQINAAKLSEHFILAGFRNDLDRLLPSLDLLVLPSFTEGLPNVVLEAFAAGVPVVATAVGGTPEIIDDDVNGYLVEAGDAARLAERIVDLLSCEVRRFEMGRRGLRRVRESFSFDAQSRLYLRLFSRLGLRAPPQTAEYLCESTR